MKIAVAKGDGIGPEIMEAVLSVFKATNVPLEYEFVDMGKWVFDKGGGGRRCNLVFRCARCVMVIPIGYIYILLCGLSLDRPVMSRSSVQNMPFKIKYFSSNLLNL